MDMRQIKRFVAIYEEGSFSKAASREKTSQPVLSTDISNLEEQLHVKLFERHARGAIPTVAGKVLYAKCITILREVNVALLQMNELASVVTGQVKIGLPQSICRGILAPLLVNYTETFPSVEVRVFQGYSPTLAAMVLSRELDFAVIASRSISNEPLDTNPIYRDRWVIVSGPNSTLIPWFPYKLQDIPNGKFIVPSSLNWSSNVVRKYLRSANIPVTNIMEIDGLSGTLRLVRETEWRMLMPFITVCNDVELNGLTVNRIAGPELSIEYDFINLPSNPLGPAALKFVEALFAQFGEATARWESMNSVPHLTEG